MSLQAIPINEPFSIRGGNSVFLATLDGNRCKTKDELLEEFVSVLKFPTYFGQNFDALYDSLTDLEWLGVDSIYLQVIHPALICSDESDTQTLEQFLDVFKASLLAFEKHPIHFFLIAEKSFLQRVTNSRFA